ncbi:MAG: peptidylprolyl isomerase, partial [Cupriavidus sp.]|nr:peptidylprolyl isomerase [Cupriavidus sp.]
MNLSRRIVLAGLMAATVLSPLAAMAQGASPAAAAPKSERVQFVTNAGKFTVEVYPDAAPKTVANFLGYVKSGFYNGTIFHRVINGFMVQGGGFDRDMKEKPTQPPIPLESRNGLKNKAGTIAMARTSDPNSA